MSIKVWYKHKRYLRRRRLVKKWGMGSEFVKQSMSYKWEVECFSLIPEDGEWHNISMSMSAWVKRDKVKPGSKVEQFLDGSLISSVKMEKNKNIWLGDRKQ